MLTTQDYQHGKHVVTEMRFVTLGGGCSKMFVASLARVGQPASVGQPTCLGWVSLPRVGQPVEGGPAWRGVGQPGEGRAAC